MFESNPHKIFFFFFFLFFSSLFQSYSTRLSALLFEDAISIHDMMGIEELGNKQSIFTKTAPLKNRGTTFTIGKRGEILNQQLEAPILVPHAQQKIRVRNFWVKYYLHLSSQLIKFQISSTHSKPYSVQSNTPSWTTHAESIFLEWSSLWYAERKPKICSIKYWAKLCHFWL